MPLRPVSPADVDDLRAFLVEADLTLAGLDDPAVRLWIERDAAGTIVGSTGFELSVDGAHALLRSVAVARSQRTAGAGTRLAGHALNAATSAGATRAWLFSRRSGPFWQRLGFSPADRDTLAAALADTHQLRLFAATGQLAREVAWSRPLDSPATPAPAPPSTAAPTPPSTPTPAPPPPSTPTPTPPCTPEAPATTTNPPDSPISTSPPLAPNSARPPTPAEGPR
ncbi:GNAT family N-acetyltransferase [Frigoribacterium sp. Leaf263]|uniref:GNAT family N-acetyltransferase n=1 Tax=Frigoribacterium sp. Leaf263 TaxID=1736313 RepID=UPI0009E75BCE|nr:GNAT family N-acetyltransferase [Frigoribacterium sp. Leaf263]